MNKENNQIKIRERRFKAGFNNPKKDRWARRVRKVEHRSWKRKVERAVDGVSSAIWKPKKINWWQKIIKFIKQLWKSKQ